MTILEIIEKRTIKEILHFTTNKGVTGILATGYLKARNLLAKDDYLEYIYQYNCANRERDKEWWNYVNLSITSVNRHLFGISAGNWHAGEDGWWCILSFSPEICAHDGVCFTTTNNMYTNGVIRQKGSVGLEAMFATNIVKWPGECIIRPASSPDNQTTCNQAEVLYPKEVSLHYLNKVYVANNDDAAGFDSIKSLFMDWNYIECEVRRELF